MESNYKFVPTDWKVRKGKKINIEWTSKYLSNEGFHKKYYRGILFELNPIRLIDKEHRLRLTNEKDIDEIAESEPKDKERFYQNRFINMVRCWSSIVCISTKIHCVIN